MKEVSTKIPAGVSRSRNDREKHKMKVYSVYILANRTNSVIYTGVTGKLERRLWEHKQHFDTHSFTARYNIDKLVWFEQNTDVKTALEREKQIKSWSRRKKNQLIEQMNPLWEDLYEKLQKEAVDSHGCCAPSE